MATLPGRPRVVVPRLRCRPASSQRRRLAIHARGPLRGDDVPSDGHHRRGASVAERGSPLPHIDIRREPSAAVPAGSHIGIANALVGLVSPCPAFDVRRIRGPPPPSREPMSECRTAFAQSFRFEVTHAKRFVAPQQTSRQSVREQHHGATHAAERAVQSRMRTNPPTVMTWMAVGFGKSGSARGAAKDLCAFRNLETS